MAIALPSLTTDSSSLGKMSDRIADELVRPDLRASHIPLAVKDAIKEAATNRFWFNEVRGLTFATVPGQDFYDSTAVPALGYLSRIDALWALINGQRRDLCLANRLDMDCWNDGQMGLTGEPAYYARYGGGILLWMHPREEWAITIDGTTEFPPVNTDNDTNAFFTDGEKYIRALAKANLLENVIRDFDQADRQWQVAEREKRTLLLETNNQTATNRNAGYL